jgi:DNA polymerase-3 subunit delta'
VGHLADALAAAADLYEAAAEEAQASLAERDVAELAELEATLSGARAGVRGSAGAVKIRGAAGAIKELQKQQKSRASRGIRDVIDHALVDLTAWYRDLLAMQVGAHVEAVHDDQRLAMEKLARASSPEQTLARIEAVLACRQSLIEYTGIAPQLAIESLAVRLQQAGR